MRDLGLVFEEKTDFKWTVCMRAAASFFGRSGSKDPRGEVSSH